MSEENPKELGENNSWKPERTEQRLISLMNMDVRTLNKIRSESSNIQKELYP